MIIEFSKESQVPSPGSQMLNANEASFTVSRETLESQSLNPQRIPPTLKP